MLHKKSIPITDASLIEIICILDSSANILSTTMNYYQTVNYKIINNL